MNILDEIHFGKSLPPRVLFSGPEGIGKTTWAAKSPAPLFLSAEDGLTGFEFMPRYSPDSLEKLHEFLDNFLLATTPYKTLVIDTLDWLERIIHASICKRDGKANIEDYGYGKGQSIASAELFRILQKLDIIRKEKIMGIIVLSHVHIKTFSSPDGNAWDRFEMKGQKSFTGIMREWPDACLFATYNVIKHKKEGRDIALDGGRIVRCEWSPGWDAKNRLNLPATLKMEYEDFEKAVAENSLEALTKKANELIGKLKNEEEKKKWIEWIGKPQPADKLKAAIKRLEEKENKQ